MANILSFCPTLLAVLTRGWLKKRQVEKGGSLTAKILPSFTTIVTIRVS
jgi:hypothetical protein